MADFVAVLRKTLDGLGETTPEVRARVYDKARATIAAKLAAIDPPPAAPVAERQKRALEDAIAAIESGYARPAPPPPPASDPLAELEHIFSSIDRNRAQPTHARPAATAPAPAAPVARAEPPGQPPRPEPRPAPAAEPVRPKPSPAAPERERPAAVAAPAAPKPTQPVANGAVPAAHRAHEAKPHEAKPHQAKSWEDPSPETGPLPGSRLAPEADDTLAGAERARAFAGGGRRRGHGGLVAAVVALLVVAGGGYGVWLNKDAFKDMLGLGKSGPAVAAKPDAPAKPAEPAAAQPAAEPQEPKAAGDDAGEPKFTQRLLPDGKEADPGPAGGESGIGEGTSVVALTTPPSAAGPAMSAEGAPAPAADADGAAADAGTPPATAEAPAAPAAGTAPAEAAAPAATAPAAETPTTVPVGQKAIFYEERTASAEGSAEPGNIVWSLVQESPGGDAPPEPAIRAEATIPGKDVQLRMTIRRNTDQTLPASHIVEMIFLTPDGFAGGGIDNVLRIAMKSTEQEAGSPLIGVPAKIADGFFLVALNDTKADEDANMTLLRNQDWIDIPVVYKSGRRALLTMEKGLPGEKVFDEALKAWQAKTSG